jgi:hypothetical protein
VKEYLRPGIRELYVPQENHLLCWAAVGLVLFRSRYGLEGRGRDVASLLLEEPVYAQIAQFARDLAVENADERALAEALTRARAEERPFGLPVEHADDFFIRCLGARAAGVHPFGPVHANDRAAFAELIERHAPLVAFYRTPSYGGAHLVLIVGHRRGDPLVWDSETYLDLVDEGAQQGEVTLRAASERLCTFERFRTAIVPNLVGRRFYHY